ncbi:hypothetical protein EON64_09055, partial [archaeon]
MAADQSDPCLLMGGFFAFFIQGCLALGCILTLVIKRQYENPKRDWYVWFLDVMKQGLGSSLGHFANIFLSQVIANKIVTADECQWYCFTYVTDSTIGTALSLLLLYWFERFLDQYPVSCRVLKFGDYGDPPQLHVFLLQLAVWLIIVLVVKVLMLAVIIQGLFPINDLIAYLFSEVAEHPRLGAVRS